MSYRTIGNVVIRSKFSRQRPGSPVVGEIYFDEATGKFLEYREVKGAHGSTGYWAEVNIQDLELGDGC